MCQSICFPNIFNNKLNQATISTFLKKLVNIIKENTTEELKYIRLLVDEPNQVPKYKKVLSNLDTEKKDNVTNG